jgi:hypothetical protein
MKVSPAKSLRHFSENHVVRGDGVIARVLLLRPEGATDDTPLERVVVHQDRAERRAAWRMERRQAKAAGIARANLPPWTPQESAAIYSVDGSLLTTPQRLVTRRVSP